MATTIVTKNSSTAAAVPTAAQLVQGELAVNVADKRLYTEDSVGGIVELGTNPSAEIVANGGIALPDNGKATFGAGDDLQIYHDGSASYIVDAGAGDLTLQSGNDLLLRDPNAQPYLNANQNAGVQVFYNGLQKLATTSTGIDVTGTATMDGLIVDAVSSNFQSTGATAISLIDTDVTNDPFKLNIENGGRDGRISAWQDIIFSNTGGTLARFDNGGDISFYEDTGTTAKLFWDASAESLGIGTASLTHALHVEGLNNEMALFKRSVTGNSEIKIDTTTGGDAKLTFANNGTSAYTLGRDNSDSSFRIASGGTLGVNDRLVIDSAGNLLVGTSDDVVWNNSANSAADNGHNLRSDGRAGFAYYNATANANATVNINRTGSDGDLIRLFKSGTAVGSIGTRGGDTVIASTSQGVRFYDANSVLLPTDEIGAGLDATISLGQSGTRWKDLYLSGGLRGDTLTFGNLAGTTEYARFDSSGNLLVGKSASSFTTAGVELAQGGTAGKVQIQRSSSPLALVNLTDDGNILNFYKGTTAVGSIGIEAGGLTIDGEAGHTGIRFGAAQIIPRDNGIDTNGATDLGFDGGSFRDAYLSGGVYLGGTGAANKLDSYEEGTFAGTLTSSVGSLTMNTSFVQMTYTKVGQLVTIFGNVVLSSVSTPSGNLRLTGLPFVCLNGTQNSERSGFAVYCTALGASTTGLNGLIIAGESQVRLTNFTGTSNADTGATLMQAGSSLTFNFSYQAA